MRIRMQSLARASTWTPRTLVTWALLVAAAAPVAAQTPAAERLNPDHFIAELDSNKDGCISRKEWLEGRLAVATYDILESESGRRDCVTARELLKGTTPAGIDSNDDGYLSVAEMRTWQTGHPAAGEAESPQSGPGKCPPYPDGRKADASPLVDAIDANRDGKMTHAEWIAAAAPEPSWNSFMSKEKIRKQGFITREDFLSDTPPNGIDGNCDGKITLEEFLATKKWARPGPPGPAPSRAP